MDLWTSGLAAKQCADFELRQRVERDALMALYSAVPRGAQDQGFVEFEQILGVLQNGGWALVEIADYKVYAPKQPQNSSWGEHHYVAYILFADGRIVSRDLGKADLINATVAKVRKLEADPESRIAAVKAAARELYEQTLGQLEPELKDERKLYVASDGDLGLVNFSALIDRKGRWLIENHLIVNLTSGRDLARLGRADPKTTSPRADYLVANPSFLFTDKRTAHGALVGSDPARQTLGVSSINCSAAFQRGESWPRIGFTKQHVDGFRAALPGLKVYDRDQAQESVIKKIEHPRTLWFITHGFFCESPAAEPGTGSDGIPGKVAVGKWDDPMQRGALVLAGAQVGGAGDGEDGYLQSAEIVDRNWEGTELVVLGACETALGVPSIGDGVYGMRRAFILAGVRSQVMTLWQVNQAQTFEVLQSFANLLHQGKGKAEALREAQRQMLRKNPHPYYWAGFHFSGDPAPLAR